jgi:hypothetical protein
MSSDDSTIEVTDYGIDDKGSIPGKSRDSFVRSYVGLFLRIRGEVPRVRISARRQTIIINKFCGSPQQILG